MGNTNSTVGGAADHVAWAANDRLAGRQQGTPPVAARSTRSPDSPQLPPARPPRDADAGSTGALRPAATLQRVSQDESPIYRLPNELLFQIGELLLELPESSSLKAAAATSVRFRQVFSPFRDRSVNRNRSVDDNLRQAREVVKLNLHNVTHGGGDDDRRLLKDVFHFIQRLDNELKSYVKHDVIDYIENTCRDDAAKSFILTQFLHLLPRLEDKSELPSTAARLASSHNSLPPEKQGAPLLAFAELIKHFLPDARESSIARLIETLSEDGEKLGVVWRRETISELAQITAIVSDDKKQAHVERVFELILKLPKVHQDYCFLHLERYERYARRRVVASKRMKHAWRELRNNVRGTFGSGPQR